MKWGQPGNLSFPWTIGHSDKIYFATLGLLFLIHIGVAQILPITEDEAYYWAWSRNPSWSYFDHPPMVAWLIRFSTFILGDSPLAIRTPAILVHFFLFYQLGSFSQNKTILYFLLFAPLSVFGAILMTPDIPLFLFWSLYVLWGLSIEKELTQWSDDPVSRVYRKSPISIFSWAKGGAWLGLGLLSKYTMALAPACLFLLWVFSYRPKSWLSGFLIHLGIAGLFFFPVLYFNYTHQFAPFLFQWIHMKQPAPSAFWLSYLGTQILLLGALPFFLLPWVVWKWPLLKTHPTYRVCTALFLIPMIFFLYKSTQNFLEANWGLVAYLSFWPLAAFFFHNTSFKPFAWFSVGVSFLIPILFSVILGIHLFTPIPWIRLSQDRFYKLVSHAQLMKEVQGSVPEKSSIPVFLPNYQWVSFFRFYGFQNAYQLPGEGRQSHFSLLNIDPCQFPSVMIFQGTGLPIPSSVSCFKKRELIRDFDVISRGQNMGQLSLIRLTQPLGTK